MHYINQLFTGIAICDVCGACWELYRVRAEEAICRCGATLSCMDEEDEPPRSQPGQR